MVALPAAVVAFPDTVDNLLVVFIDLEVIVIVEVITKVMTVVDYILVVHPHLASHHQ